MSHLVPDARSKNKIFSHFRIKCAKYLFGIVRAGILLMACPRKPPLGIAISLVCPSGGFGVGLSTAIALFVPFLSSRLGSVCRDAMHRVSTVLSIIFRKKAQKGLFPLLSLTLFD